jgi:hypothetical protein
MSDPSLETTNDLLSRLVRAVERKELGLTTDPPGSITLYANRVKAPDGCVWYRWDPQAEEPIAVEERYVRGRLTDLLCYEKSSAEGTTVKVRAILSAGRTQYEIETSLTATSGRGLVSGLVEAGEEALQRPITVGAEAADKDQVLFMSVFTEEGGKQYPDSTPDGQDALISATKRVREWLGLEPSPWTDRFSNGAEPRNDAPQGPPPRGAQPGTESGAKPSGDARASGTQNGRQKHPSEKAYSRGQPAPGEAAQALVRKASDVAAPDELTENVTLPGGEPLEAKVKGLLGYCDRDEGYLARCLDVMGVQSAGHVAIAELPDLVELIVSEETLRQNESFEPDDDLPF